ncbi:MAG: hypothetical protein C5B43_01260 [Verrucomicrobia bacterium]|nr:MAG: hypothetical protein C5B43_01260 [Verrucomicrobiota bacterium]
MVFQTNFFSNQLALEAVLQDDDLYEMRLENDSQGRVVYTGQCTIPNGDTSELIWFIKKISYDSNGYIDRIQLPVNGIGFMYSWDQRATYF